MKSGCVMFATAPASNIASASDEAGASGAPADLGAVWAVVVPVAVGVAVGAVAAGFPPVVVPAHRVPLAVLVGPAFDHGST